MLGMETRLPRNAIKPADNWLIVATRRNEDVVNWMLARSLMEGVPAEVRWVAQGDISIYRSGRSVVAGASIARAARLVLPQWRFGVDRPDRTAECHRLGKPAELWFSHNPSGYSTSLASKYAWPYSSES